MSSSQSPLLWVNQAPVAVPSFDPNQSLLHFLREQCGLTGTKEGCGSGDCGACTVILRDGASGDTATLNACITPLGAALGHQVVTVEGVGSPTALHPVQQAMVDEHGSQCGFCTPGFVMSLVGRQLSEPAAAALAGLGRDELIRSISGNLCRCTGYRPILSAARRANQRVGEAPDRAPGAWVPALQTRPAALPASALPVSYARPGDEPTLQRLMAAHPDRDRVPLIAGSTDLWLEVAQRYRDFAGFIDVTGVDALRRIERRDDRLVIGAAVTHAALAAWFADGPEACPAVVEVMHRFGSPQIRGRGTLGGNLANGSPIADWPPLLLAVDAQVLLCSAAGVRRTVPLAGFYRDYRQTVLADDEYLAAVEIDGGIDWPALQAFKISKREDDDISSTLGAFYITRRAGSIDACRIAFGGVAATPVRFPDVEAILLGRRVDGALIDAACARLRDDLAPISDVRASADYRRAVSVNLLRKALQGLLDDRPQTLAAVLGS